MSKLKNVIIRFRGVPIAPRTNVNNIADPDTGETVTIGGGGGGGGTTPTSVKYASSAGVASDVTTSLKTELITSAVAAVPAVTSTSSANVASSLTAAAKVDIINSAIAAVPAVTSVASAGIADDLAATVKNEIINSAATGPITSVASAGVADAVAATERNAIITSAVAAVPTITSVESAGVADSVAATERNAIINSAVAAVPTTTFVASAGVADDVTAECKTAIIESVASAISTDYTGPWCVSKQNNNIVINSGGYWLGDTLQTCQGSSLASANGNVYFYTYYQGGSYYSGIMIAQDSSTLPNAATGSAGYYTIIGNVTAQGITQYQYGTFRIDGRLV